MPIVNITPKIREIGRIRMGTKGAKGNPMRLDKFRLTTADRPLLEHAARLYGGTVQPWKDQPGQYELFIEAEELPCMVAPMEVSQWYEQWTAGGCTHRCDGQQEMIRDRDCECDPDNRKCKTTTRMSVYLPDLPGLGVWRLETHGFYAATELPQAAEMLIQLARGGQFPDAALAIEQREVKRDGQTKKFPVPVLRIKTALRQLMTGEVIDVPVLADHHTPALPSGEPPQRVQQAVQKNERSDYAGATGARPQPPKETRPTAPPPGQGVIEAEVVDDDRQARAEFAASFTEHAKALGWENKTRVAFLRHALSQPELKAIDGITVPQWETITNTTEAAVQDREACLALWRECCDLWGADSTDTLARDEWFAQAVGLPAPAPLTVYMPGQWSTLRLQLCEAKADSVKEDTTSDIPDAPTEPEPSPQGELFGEA